MEWAKEKASNQYNSWYPWVEDQYLYYFTKDNKTSYATKQELDKTKITGNEQIDGVQDGVNNLVGGQVGKGGLLQPVGDAVSKEGVNRAERSGKDDKGSYGGPAGSVTDPIADKASEGGSAISSGASGAAEKASGAASSAGGYVSSLWGGGKKEEKK